MKHLRKYNESIESNKVDNVYIKNCFIEFIDNGCDIETEFDRTDLNAYAPGKIPLYGPNGEEFEVSSYILLSLEFPELSDKNNLSKFIKYTEELKEILLEIETSIKKVKLKYPNIKYVFNNYMDDAEIIFYV